MNFAVFVSGFGSNLQAIIKAVRDKKIRAKLKLVVSDKKDAYALERAHKAKLKTLFIEPADFPQRELYDQEVMRHLQKEEVDFIVLAGFMRILSLPFIKRYEGKILNIHPSLLPAFRGASAIRDAFEYGVQVTGVTVHFVEEKVDLGPIVLQETVVITPKDTMASLEKKIHKVEHQLYPKAINLFAKGKIVLEGRRVVLK